MVSRWARSWWFWGLGVGLLIGGGVVMGGGGIEQSLRPGASVTSGGGVAADFDPSADAVFCGAGAEGAAGESGRASLAEMIAETPLGFFSGWGAYMPRTHCLMTAEGRPDWPWIGALVVLTVSVIVGYLRIFFFWRRAYLREDEADRNRKMMHLAYIFLFCAVCGYGFALLMYVWPAYRLLAVFLVALNVFTWRFAYDLSGFGVSLSARRLERELAETLAERDAQLRSLIACLPDMVFYKDTEGRYLDFNDKFCELFGWTREQLQGSRDHDLFPAEVADEFRADDRKAEREGLHSFVEWVDTPTQGRRKLHTSKRAVHDDAGRLRGVACVARDITELHEKQEALKQAKAEAETANEAKTTFLANISHEIRTPLTGVLGFAELLTEQPDADRATRQDWSGTIQRSAQHLQTLLNDVLDVSKIEAGRMDIERRPMDLPALLSDLVSSYRPQAVSRGLTLDLSCPRPLPRTIESDPTRLRQVLSNLISNALKFTEDGGVRVEVELNAAEDDRGADRLRIDVVDTGPGVSEEKQARLFQRFAQADSSVSREHGGTGLGLVIARFFCEALGGGLRMESREGFGTRMTAEIDPGDLAGVEMIDAGEAVVRRKTTRPEASVTRSGAERGAGSGVRVLVVDDGPTNRKYVRTVLEAAGYGVATAEDGRAGVAAALSDESYALILMDMQMPVLDGYAAARELREAGCVTPIVALTASVLAGDRRRCLHAGCTDYLTKPIERGVLLQTIAGHVDPSADHEKTPADEAADPDVEALVPGYLAELGGTLAAMQSCLDDGRADELARLAHRVVGSGGTLGFPQLSDLSERLERLARTDKADACREALRQLRDAHAAIRSAREVRGTGP